MKKNLLVFLMIIMVLNVSAQIERKPTVIKPDSVKLVAPFKPTNQPNRSGQLKDLDLTKEQLILLKAIRETTVKAKAIIENDTIITDSEKKKQIRVLQKEQAKKMQAILTPEQQMKFKQVNPNHP